MDELFVLCLGFWLFVFSSSFRKQWISDFKKANVIFKVIDSGEAIISVGIGVILPVWGLYTLLGKAI